MIYRLKQGETIQSAAKFFGYSDYKKFFKTMRYVGNNKTFTPGTVIEAPSEPPSSRDRAYNGQNHTDEGTRGKTFVEGLTMRDVADCMNRAFALASGEQNPEQYGQANNGDSLVDLYALDLSKMDPGAMIQNAMCEVERMMGIFPNIPPLEDENEAKLQHP